MLRSLLRRIKSARRRKELEQTARHVTGEELTGQLRTLGLGQGDIVFLHSSLKSLGFVEGGPRAVLDALLDAIGPAGTLVVPTYYLPGGSIYATCQIKDYVFDPHIHGTQLGALPSEFLKLPGVKRSIHPTHSVSALGVHAAKITETHHLAPSIFGPGSPWAQTIALKGKVLGLGVSMGPVTFYHTVEDHLGDAFPLPVRMSEEFTLHCLDWERRDVRVPVRPLDPKFMPRRIDHPSRDDLRDYFWREFTATGLLKSGPIGGSTSWFVPARAFFDHLVALAGDGVTIYSTPQELAQRPVGRHASVDQDRA